MAKILFGVCGVGYGHAIRSKILLEELAKNHDLFIVAGQLAYSYLKDNFKNVCEVDGLELAFKENRVNSLRTILKNIKKISMKNYNSLKRIKGKIDLFKPEIVISDFEAFSIYYAGDKKLKVIGFDNEHYILDGNFNVPGKYKVSYLKSKIIVNFYNINASIIYLLPDQKLNENSKAFSLMPVLRNEIIKSKPKNNDYILVYTSVIKHEKIFEVFKKFNEKFIIFGDWEDKKYKNLVFKKFNEKEFLRFLLNCKAIITTAGINLISEAIYLGKPILALPIKNQFEQILNALYVKENNYGEYCEDITENILKYFLKNLSNYKKYSFVPGNKNLFNLVEKLIKVNKIAN